MYKMLLFVVILLIRHGFILICALIKFFLILNVTQIDFLMRLKLYMIEQKDFMCMSFHDFHIKNFTI